MARGVAHSSLYHFRVIFRYRHNISQPASVGGRQLTGPIFANIYITIEARQSDMKLLTTRCCILLLCRMNLVSVVTVACNNQQQSQ